MQGASNVALLINRNARKVNDRVLRRIMDVVPEHQVYATSTKEESRDAVRDILDRGYGNVFSGGGDGTFLGLINTLVKEAPDSEWPRLGVLRLGTGNALAELVSTGSPEDDLRAFLDREPKDDVPLSLIQDQDGTLFPFGGLGWDARILNDFRILKRSSEGTIFSPVLGTLSGYFAAAFGRTIPTVAYDTLRGHKCMARLISTGDQAFALGENGVVRRYIPRGEILYEGPFSLLIAGTTPFYGYGMKILPYAGRYPSMFQIRVATPNVPQAIQILPKIWNGTYNGRHVTDFAAESLRIELSHDTPYQLGGDPCGECREVEFRVAPQPLRLIRLI